LTNISNVLTLEERRKMTSAQKESWRAKQADLTSHRKDFHGVVTYTFDGVFSWQMYGSAEAVDETGSNYTEYLMRCQWGTSFENMQPWIVAHRYKEFDQLDQQLKRKFPRHEQNMPKLPKKEIFRSLQSDVVAERRASLEQYMSKIVVSMPTLLRSELMNDFLDITNRISGIRLLLLKQSNPKDFAALPSTPAPSGTGTGAASSSSSSKKNNPLVPTSTTSSTAVPGNSKYGIEDPLSLKSAQAASPKAAFAGDDEQALVRVVYICECFLLCFQKKVSCAIYLHDTIFCTNIGMYIMIFVWGACSCGVWMTRRRRARPRMPAPWTRTPWASWRWTCAASFRC
jgi:hypothetical protein